MGISCNGPWCGSKTLDRTQQIKIHSQFSGARIVSIFKLSNYYVLYYCSIQNHIPSEPVLYL